MLDNVFLDEQYMKQQNTLAALIPLGERTIESIFRSCGSHLAGQPADQQIEEVKVEHIIQDKVIEKTNFDVMLLAIDAKSKIKVIKEVRSMCGLGLKEAKDMVEKLPGLLSK
jgi:hypothetical protein